MKLRRILCILAAALLFVQALPTGWGREPLPPEGCIQKMLNVYRCYQSDAWEEVESLLRELENQDPEQGRAWRGIMTDWRRTVEDTPLCYDSLPEGLPGDSSLGIVIMGYGLNANGSIRPELRARLTVGLAAARQYPNAKLIVTGGPTAYNSDRTEAGMMELWLRLRGIPQERIVTEARSMSTAENACNVYRILNETETGISCLAIVTSDYHIYRSVMDFSAVSHYYSNVAGLREIPVVAHACCDPGYERSEGLDSHAADIAAITGIELEYQRGSSLYPVG